MVKSLSKVALIVAGAAVVLGLVSGPTYADINPIFRFNDYSTTFDNPNDFANTVGQFGINQTWSVSAQGTTSNATFGLANGFYNLSWTGDANIGVSNITTTATTVSGTLTALTGSNGSTSLIADFPANNGNPITVGVVGGSYVLEEKFSSPGGVIDGSTYIWQMVLPGDWSAVGTGPGDHELVSINAAWTIDKDFTFDGTNTTFRAELDNYLNDGAHNINIDFQLYGAAVPLPPSALLLGSGLLGLVGWRRFRKS